MTFNEGKLVPFFVDEVLPGDTISLTVRDFCRLATPVAPFMDNLYLDKFFFFVPNRLVWEHWQNFCFEQEDPDDSTDYVVPTCQLAGGTAGENGIGTVWDYFALPTGLTNALNVNALPFRMYYLIWNEWFRDENLQKSVKIDKSDTNAVFKQDRVSDQPSWIFSTGTTYVNGFALAPRGKRFDYFTSALPFQQKGPGVSIGLAGTASVDSTIPIDWPMEVKPNGGSYSTVNRYELAETDYATRTGALWTNNSNRNDWSGTNLKLPDFSEGLTVDLDSSSIFTISSLRTAFQMQKFYERLARGGSRYTEVLTSFFGVVSPDSRLQRPEYLGGSSKMMNINPVAQTSSTGDVTPQGNLAAYGVSASKYHAFTKSFVEHGYIIGLLEVRADLTYQQGINKMWLRSTVYDWFWPTFAHLSEQAILNAEIYAQGTDEDKGVFGYQERYAEYRYHPSEICGHFRSTYTKPLDVWHLSQKFDSLPTLSDQFIQDNPPVDRVVAVKNYPHFLIDIGFKYHSTRAMPMYGIPGLVDHF
nr:MAG TPA: Capsid protein [Microviridae sp.]